MAEARFGRVVLSCGIPPCTQRIAFDWSTKISATRAARLRGWTAGSNLVTRCPCHRNAVAPPKAPQQRRGAPVRFDADDATRIAELYAQGLSLEQLAERFGSSPTAIRSAIVRRGGTLRPTGRQKASVAS